MHESHKHSFTPKNYLTVIYYIQKTLSLRNAELDIFQVGGKGLKIHNYCLCSLPNK